MKCKGGYADEKCMKCPIACEWAPGVTMAPVEESCSLTPPDMDIIKAMIEGKWLCTKCVHYRSAKGCGWASQLACETWEERKDGGS